MEASRVMARPLGNPKPNLRSCMCQLGLGGERVSSNQLCYSTVLGTERPQTDPQPIVIGAPPLQGPDLCT